MIYSPALMKREAPASAPPSGVAFPMSLPLHPVTRWIKMTAGSALAGLMPGRARELMTTDAHRRYSQVDRWILAALGHRAMRDGKLGDLHRIHQRFWSTPGGAQLMVDQPWRYEHLFLAQHRDFIGPFITAVRSLGCQQLIDVGCGTGEILDHLLRTLPMLRYAYGIDLNPQLIEHCSARWRDPRVSFVCGDGASLLMALSRPPTAMLTYGGVLEYFLEDDIRRMYSWLATHARPCVVGCVESIDDALVLGAGNRSRPFGYELSFAHDYPALLREAGFTIRFAEDLHSGSQRYVMVVAEAL